MNKKRITVLWFSGALILQTNTAMSRCGCMIHKRRVFILFGGSFGISFLLLELILPLRNLRFLRFSSGICCFWLLDGNATKKKNYDCIFVPIYFILLLFLLGGSGLGGSVIYLCTR